MQAFYRVFKYVWPQWHRVVISVVCALIVAALLSLSYATVIPLLKVVISSEGLHPWVDRAVCQVRYGVTFAKSLSLVTQVDPHGLAAWSGLQVEDRIVGIEDSNEVLLSPPYCTEILRVLASTADPSVILHIERVQPKSEGPATMDVTLHTPGDDAFLADHTSTSGVSAWSRRIKTALITTAHRFTRIIPRDKPGEKTSENTMKAITFIIVLVLITTVIRGIAKYFQAYLAQNIVLIAVYRLRCDIYSHLLRMPIGRLTGERPSDTISRILQDTKEMSEALRVILGKAIREPLNALCAVTLAMWINWQLTTIFILGGPFIVILVVYFGKTMKRAARKTLINSAQMLSKLEESVVGLKVVKICDQYAHEQTSFERIGGRLLEQQINISHIESATSPVLEILGLAAACAAIFLGTHWVTQNNLDGETFLGLLLLIGASAEAARKASDVWNKVQQASAAAERVFELMDQPLETDDAGAQVLAPFGDQIEFKDVVFTYPGNTDPALNGINLTIQAGQTIAIVGPNGSGKTTLANLLPRFYDPDAGRILIDHVDIRAVSLVSLRNQFGMVTQQVVSFCDTVANNIAYGKRGATRDEIVAAAKQAFADEFIRSLPQGYDTIIGEGGTGLSGGQLQRIVIARAIVNNPGILLFDEATSQIDAESESKIHKALEKVMKNRTTLIIAHRFSTVVAADHIIVIDKGEIVAQGTHDELMGRCCLYQGLYETQWVK